jgi:hypothetical protein
MVLDKSASVEQRSHRTAMHGVPLPFMKCSDNVLEWQAVRQPTQDGLERTPIRLTQATP